MSLPHFSLSLTLSHYSLSHHFFRISHHLDLSLSLTLSLLCLYLFIYITTRTIFFHLSLSPRSIDLSIFRDTREFFSSYRQISLSPTLYISTFRNTSTSDIYLSLPSLYPSISRNTSICSHSFILRSLYFSHLDLFSLYLSLSVSLTIYFWKYLTFSVAPIVYIHTSLTLIFLSLSPTCL